MSSGTTAARTSFTRPHPAIHEHRHPLIRSSNRSVFSMCDTESPWQKLYRSDSTRTPSEPFASRGIGDESLGSDPNSTRGVRAEAARPPRDRGRGWGDPAGGRVPFALSSDRGSDFPECQTGQLSTTDRGRRSTNPRPRRTVVRCRHDSPRQVGWSPGPYCGFLCRRRNSCVPPHHGVVQAPS